MQVRILQGLVAMLGRVPLPLNHRCGALLGWLMWRLPTRARRVTEINLKLCFPDWSVEQRRSLARRSLIETGKSITECAWIWTRPRPHIESRVRDIVGAEVLGSARQGSSGTLIASPHLGSWELCNLPISREKRITYLYRSPRNAALDPLLIRWRANLDADPARLDASGIKHVLRLLKSGDMVGVLPDQEPERSGGVFADFFGVPANTMTLLSKLANSGRANVVFCFSERLPNGRGWRIHFLEPDPDTTHPNRERAAAALNRTIETCIALCPEQYLWSYRRFRLLSDGGRRPYR